MGHWFMKAFENNLKYITLFSISRFGLFFQPIMFAYFDAKGVEGVYILNALSIFNLVLVFLEIPAGYIADLTNRVKILIFSSIMFLIAYCNYYFVETNYGLVISFIFMALGMAFYSGVLPAILYDSLLKQHLETDFKRYNGKILAYSAYMTGIAAFMAGFLFELHVELPLLLNIVFFTSSVFLAFKIKDVIVIKEKKRLKRHYITEMVATLKYLSIDHPEIKWIILFSIILYVGTSLNLHLMQILWKIHNIPIWLYGILALAAQLLNAFSMKQTHYLVTKFGESACLTALWLLLAICFLMMGLIDNVVAVVFSVLPPFIAGMSITIISDMTHKRVESKMRVTLTSLNSTAFRIFQAIFLQIAIFAIANGAINSFYIACSFLLFLTGGAILMLMKRKNIFK